jgi:hypothetical protein
MQTWKHTYILFSLGMVYLIPAGVDAGVSDGSIVNYESITWVHFSVRVGRPNQRGK